MALVLKHYIADLEGIKSNGSFPFPSIYVFGLYSMIYKHIHSGSFSFDLSSDDLYKKIQMVCHNNKS